MNNFFFYIHGLSGKLLVNLLTINLLEDQNLWITIFLWKFSVDKIITHEMLV
jgi:hypothetical protein